MDIKVENIKLHGVTLRKRTVLGLLFLVLSVTPAEVRKGDICDGHRKTRGIPVSDSVQVKSTKANETLIN